MSEEQHYRRNPDLLPEWGDGSRMVVRDCRQWRMFTVQPELLTALSHLDRPRTAEDLHALWPRSPGPEAVAALLGDLARAGIVHPCGPGPQDDAKAPEEGRTDGRTPYELAVHRQAGTAATGGRDLRASPPAHWRHDEALATVALPETTDVPSRSLATVLSERRSIRAFAPHPVPLTGLAAFLDRAARVRGYLSSPDYQQTQRPAPSGGARHSLEIYLLAREVAGLEAGAYHYDPFAHTLNRLTPWDEGLTGLQHRLVVVPAQMREPPPVSLYLTSCVARTAWKYSGMALAMIYRDTGCLLQTMCLTATDLGLGACPVGAVDGTLSPPFLASYRDRLIHVGSLALGLPASDRPPPPVLPLRPGAEPPRVP